MTNGERVAISTAALTAERDHLKELVEAYECSTERDATLLNHFAAERDRLRAALLKLVVACNQLRGLAYNEPFHAALDEANAAFRGEGGHP